MPRKKIKVNRMELRDGLMELSMEMKQCDLFLTKLMTDDNVEVKKAYAELMHNIFASYINEIPRCIEEL